MVLATLTVGVTNWSTAEHYWPVYLFLVIGLIVVGVLWAISRRSVSNIFAATFGWLPVFVGALSYIFWYWYASLAEHDIDPTFFHAAADVLPILLLATVVDVHRTKELENKQLVLPIAAVFLGELAALNALAFGYARPADFAAVASSFVSTIVALVLAVLADMSPPTSKEHPGSDSAASENGAQPRIGTEIVRGVEDLSTHDKLDTNYPS